MPILTYLGIFRHVLELFRHIQNPIKYLQRILLQRLLTTTAASAISAFHVI